MATPAMADETKPGFDGTWGGADGDLTAQVIITGGQVIGFFWRTDYLDGPNARVSADGRVLSFDFDGGHASLTRIDASTAALEVREGDKTTRLQLKRD